MAGLAGQTQPLGRRLGRRLGLALPAGILIASLAECGPAAKAGLRPGDLILAIDGEPTPSVDAVHRLLDRHSIGRRLTLRVLREGKLIDMRARGGSKPDSAARSTKLIIRQTSGATETVGADEFIWFALEVVE